MSLRAALAAAVLLVAGCSDAGPRGATLRVDLVDPVGDAASRRAVAEATAVGLVDLDGAGHVVPALASSWRIAGDGRGVIFRLAPRRWPDGAAVTARDVVVALRRTAAAPGPFHALLAGITVDAPVDNVVDVHAAAVMPGLLALLAQPELAVDRPDTKSASLGPFRVTDPARRPLVLTRTPAIAGVTTLVLTATDDPGAAVARFARDRTDLVIGDGIAGFSDARLLARGNVLRVEPTWGVYGYRVNTSRGALADPRVRRALAMAVERDDLGSRMFGIALAPVLGLVPALPSEPAPALPDWAIAAPAARLDLARQLLAAAGFGPASPLKVMISLPDAREHVAVAASVVADWARLGVVATTVVRSPAAHALAVARGDFDLALVERTSAVDTPLAFLLPFACGARATYCNPGADALLAGTRAEADPVAAAAALGAGEAAMVADTPLIALFTPFRWALVAPHVGGWTSNAADAHPLARLTVGRRVS